MTLLSFLGGWAEVAGWRLVYRDYRVNSRYHLEVLCIIRKLETARFVSELNNRVAAMFLLFAVISTVG